MYLLKALSNISLPSLLVLYPYNPFNCSTASASPDLNTFFSITSNILVGLIASAPVIPFNCLLVNKVLSNP